MKTKFAILTMATLALAGCENQAGNSGGGGSRDQIRIVGSSTVFPFAKAVSENFVTAGSYKAPVLESTGTGAGMSLFCSGVGADTPDIENASRRMKASEFELCQTNGVTDIVEINIGIDGIAVAQSELIMEVGCKTDPATKALKDSNKDEYEAICHDIRTDGPYLDAGENDNLIVQKLKSNPNAVGIFGYSFLEENLDTVRGIAISGVEPAYDAIASGEYPGARPLFIYVKKQHVGVIPGIEEYVTEFVNAGTRDGYLVKAGLIASPDATRASMLEAAKNMPLLTKDVLK